MNEALSAQKGARPARHEQPEGAIEASQRLQVEVVVMQVGDQHRVDVARNVRRWRRRMAPDMRDPRAQYRVSEQAHATELEEQGGVSDEGEPVRRLSRP